MAIASTLLTCALIGGLPGRDWAGLGTHNRGGIGDTRRDWGHTTGIGTGIGTGRDWG